MADVQNCLIILQHILMRMQPEEAATWENVWLPSEMARIPAVTTFGKHKGQAIEDIPADYKRWLLGHPDLEPYLIRALRGEA